MCLATKSVLKLCTYTYVVSHLTYLEHTPTHSPKLRHGLNCRFACLDKTVLVLLTLIHPYPHQNTQTRTSTYAHTLTHMPSHIHTDTNTYTHTHTHTHTHTLTHTHIHTYTQTYTQTQSYMKRRHKMNVHLTPGEPLTVRWKFLQKGVNIIDEKHG